LVAGSPPATRRAALAELWQRRAVRDTLAAALFLAPFLVFYVLLKMWPIVYGFWISLHRWETIGMGNAFIGGSNYERILEDRIFWQAVTNTALFTAIATPLLVGLGLGLALILDRAVFGRAAFRAIYYLPAVLSTAVIGLIFLAVLRADETGLLNKLLSLVGLGPVPFLLDATAAMPSIALAALWWTVGFNMLILLAGLQNVPPEVNDSARVDGASGRRLLWHITLPLLRRPLVLVTVLQVIACFQVFGLIDVMTKGGPGGATRSVVYYIFERAFTHGQLGYASAIAFCLFVILFVLSVTQLRLFRRGEDAV
jgi:multiple sugar transport system permease protein